MSNDEIESLCVMHETPGKQRGAIWIPLEDVRRLLNEIKELRGLLDVCNSQNYTVIREGG